MNEKEFFSSTTRRVANSLSCYFDGINDRILVKNKYQQPFGAQMSVFAWVKAKAQNAGVIMSQWDIVGNRRSWLMSVNTSRFEVTMSVDGGSSNLKDYVSATGVFDGVDWVHVGFVFNAGVLKLYVNGLPIVVTTIADAAMTDVFDGGADLLIGASNTQRPTAFLGGKIDEVVLHDLAMSDQEVEELWNQGRPGDIAEIAMTTRPLSWWRMEDAEDRFPTVPDRFGVSDGLMFGMVKENLVEDIP